MWHCAHRKTGESAAGDGGQAVHQTGGSSGPGSADDSGDSPADKVIDENLYDSPRHDRGQ